MKILTYIQCFELMGKMQMPEHIVAHSLQVHRVAMCLIGDLKSRGLQLNGQLVQAAALLHDITKSRSFETAENHALTGGQKLTDLGYPEIGNLVRQHVQLDDYSESKNLAEAEMVNYADKRVLHDRIVSLDERMNYIMERYGHEPAHQQRIQMLWEKTRTLEKRIFSYLPVAPNDLNQHLTRLDVSGEISFYRRICSRLAAGGV